MAYQVLARKYRPKKFDEVIGQSHITGVLENALQSNKLGHAYLFTGTRGIGKTSIARIFAKALRCLDLVDGSDPCNKCDGCLDYDTGNSLNVVEIDGASNNSVDDARELINNVQFLPSFGKYKIYIIDEIHMLSPSAFNALLKTLEEPPAHVIFLFATTEPHKVLETVLSRCQRLDFRNSSKSELVEHIKMVATKEHLNFVDEKPIELIAELGNGSFRDTLSLLDQVISYSYGKEINEEITATALGLASKETTSQLLKAILLGDAESFKSTYHSAIKKNIQIKNLTSALLDAFYKCIDLYPEFSKRYPKTSLAEVIWIYETFANDSVWALNSLMPEKTIEVNLLKICYRNEFFQKKNSEELVVEDQIEQSEVVEQVEIVEQPKVETPIVEKNIPSWEGLLDFLRTKSISLASNLEQGNLVGEIGNASGKFFAQIGFNESSMVFYEYLQGPEIKSRLSQYFAEYLGVKIEDTNLDLKVVDRDISEKINFKSTLDIIQEKEQQDLDKTKDDFLNNPMLLQAQKLFNAKIDKVHIKKENK